ncbi:hypothetical protein BJY00DRAFT_274347 [Aspergillus carlsbadensis]|nr:hypothetical protein BJY00DRAFT_274347 [Aspergillus carlsbadensis]
MSKKVPSREPSYFSVHSSLFKVGVIPLLCFGTVLQASGAAQGVRDSPESHAYDPAPIPTQLLGFCRYLPDRVSRQSFCTRFQPLKT